MPFVQSVVGAFAVVSAFVRTRGGQVKLFSSERQEWSVRVCFVHACSTQMSKLSSRLSAIPVSLSMTNCARSYTKILLISPQSRNRLSGYGACFFCLGVSAAGMKEEAYRRLTYDLTVSVARTLAKLKTTMTFIYVSGAGTDSTERGRQMWARVKGRTENTLLEMPFKAVYLFRPAYIQPLYGVRTKTAWYGAAYAVMRPFYPVLKTLFPNYVTTTECVGHAMLNVSKRGFPNPVLENRDINRMCAKES